MKVNNIVLSLFSFLIPALILIHGKSYSYTIIPFMIIGLISLYWCDRKNFDYGAKIISLSFTLYFLCTLVSLLLLGGSFSNLDAPSRAFLIIPALAFCLSFKPQKYTLVYGILVGASISGFVALYHQYIIGTRPFDEIWRFMVIQSGNIAMSLGLFSLASAFYLKRNSKGRLLITLAFLASILGLLASLMSGSRGGWVLSPILILAIIYINRKELHLITWGLVIASTLTIAYTAHPMISKRVELAIEQLQSYDTPGYKYSSVGVRLDMWKAGAHAFIENPVFGTGYEQREQSKLDAIKDGWANKSILKHSRLHNSYIEEASIKGVIGLIVLLIFFGGPLYVFITMMSAHNNIYAILGIVHVLSVMGYCLTQNFINHQSGMLFYIAFTVLFYSFGRHYSEEAE